MASNNPRPERNAGGPRIAVLGSINMDLLIRCAKLPTPGETVSARSLVEIPGGKGANQAVAAARAGGHVRMIGCVGDDAFGPQLLENLVRESVDCDSISSVRDCPSGIAIVGVEDSGENSIIVVPGANGRLDAPSVRQLEDVIVESDILMVQLETPLGSVQEAVRIARKNRVKVVLDPAPVTDLPPEMFDVDVMCPNESEAASLVGDRLESIDDAERIAKSILSRGPRAVIITLGSRGSFLCDGKSHGLIESQTIDAIDTTAAGDAFAGALAVRWAETGNLRDSIRWANAAGALAASKLGAQPSLPTRREIDDFDAARTA